MVFVGEGRPEQRHDAIAHDLVDRALIAVDGGHHGSSAGSRSCRASSGSRSPSNSIDPFRSANSTVTCLRSPSSAVREVRIFSAR